MAGSVGSLAAIPSLSLAFAGALATTFAPAAARADRARAAQPVAVASAAAPSPHTGSAPSAAPSGDTAADLPDEAELTGCKRYPDGKRFRLTLRGEVGVAELVSIVGPIACQTILVGPAVAARSGKVSLQAPDQVTAPELYRIFHSALETLGLTIERHGRAQGRGSVWKVVESTRARELSTISTTASADAAALSGEQFVTRLVRLRNAGAAEIGDVIQKLRSREGDVTLYAPGQSLIITDRASIVRRMETLIGALDVAQPGQRIWSVAAHRQSASELAGAIDKILQATRRTSPAGPAGPASGPGASARAGDPSAASLVAVDAARLLMVVGDEPAYRRVAGIAARIDPPDADGGTSQVHVVYLAHTNAEEMAATLRDLGLAQHSAGRPGASSSSGSASPLQGDVRVSADKAANAIVVFAGGADFLMVRDLITRLDLPRRQVYVEAAILDLSVSRARDVGVAFHAGDSSSSGTTVVGASGSSGATSIALDAKSLAAMFAGGGLTTGVFGKAFEYSGISVPSFGVVLKALETDKDVHVISQPHLLTMDNAKASLSVGQSIPFPTQSLAAATVSTVTPSILNSYQRQDVALKLELTPHLNESESIRLELDGEISDVPDGQSTQAGGPTTNKRTIKTSIVVGDGETVVLGGLQKQVESTTIEKVPLLGDIPILGRLFQYRTTQRGKQDLMIAITPWVIRGPEDLRRIFERKQQDQREFDARFAASDGPQPPGGFNPHVDYSRRRGLLEEVNRTARAADHEARLVREAEASRRAAPVEGEVN